MAEQRRRDQWSHTAELLAMIANASPNRDPKARASEASDFDPYHVPPEPKVATMDEIWRNLPW
jgi:hypothetical protein